MIFYFIYKNSIFLWCPEKIFLSCILIFGHVWEKKSLRIQSILLFSFKSSTWGFRAHKLGSWHKGKMLQKIHALLYQRWPHLTFTVTSGSHHLGEEARQCLQRPGESRELCAPGPREAQCQWDCQGHLPLYLRWAPGIQYPRPTPLKHKEVVLFQETREISWSRRTHLFSPLMASRLEHQGGSHRWSQKGPLS